MKEPRNEQVMRIGMRAIALAVAAHGFSACALPPRETWARLKGADEGVMKGLVVPKRTMASEDGGQRLAGTGATAGAENRRRDKPAQIAAVAEYRGYVYSPYTWPRKLVNVKDFKPGDTALCPYTMEPFIVPGAPADHTAGVLAQVESPASGAGDAAAFGPPDLFSASEPATFAATGGGFDSADLANPAVEEIGITSPDSPISDPSLLPPPSQAPFGNWVEGKPGHVYSPFAARHQLVDVTGLLPGTEVHCPYSGKIFRVPGTESPLIALEPALPDPSLPATDLPAAAPDSPSPGSLAGPVSTPKSPASAPVSQPRTAATPKYGAATSRQPPKAPPATTLPTPAPADQAKPEPAGHSDLPTASWAPNKPGLVQSPFGTPGQLVDVTGKSAGARVICPHTNKPFRVPAP